MTMINTDEMRKIIKTVEEVRQSVLARCETDTESLEEFEGNMEYMKNSAVYSIQDFLTNLNVDNEDANSSNLSADCSNEDQVYTGNG